MIIVEQFVGGAGALEAKVTITKQLQGSPPQRAVNKKWKKKVTPPTINKLPWLIIS